MMDVTTWSDLKQDRVPHPNISPDNGFNLCGYELPENALENILCWVPKEEILKCNQVCRVWKDVITRKSFWKKCYDIKRENWGNLPFHIIDKPEGWIVLYSRLCHGSLYDKNFIANPSGHLNFDKWTKVVHRGDGWLVEQEPGGCDQLPEDPFFGSIIGQSCFVSSYGLCSKSYVVDLWESGLNPTVMRISLPLQIKCSQMYDDKYASRFDCGAIFYWDLRLLDSEQKIIRRHNAEFRLPASMDWKTAQHSFNFKQSHADSMSRVRYLEFIHMGKDTQFWAGHYGMKFARACVTVQPLTEDPESDGDDELDEHPNVEPERTYEADMYYELDPADDLERIYESDE